MTLITTKAFNNYLFDYNRRKLRKEVLTHLLNDSKETKAGKPILVTVKVAVEGS